MSLKDKVVVITGGGSGIGRAMCRLFADRGAKVVVAEIDEEKGEEVVRTIKEAKGDASFVKVDVKEPEEVKALIDRTIENFGRLDVLINNAGIMSEPRKLHETPLDVFDEILKTNLNAVFYCMKYAIQRMLGRGGVVINIASAIGIRAMQGLSAYCASKSGVIQLTKVAALEYAKDNIRVVAIAPGPVDTPLVRGMDEKVPGYIERVKEKTPMGRLASPDEIARVALFLASDEASYITGSVISVDGGRTA